jgi:hypothetical protein
MSDIGSGLSTSDESETELMEEGLEELAELEDEPVEQP